MFVVVGVVRLLCCVVLCCIEVGWCVVYVVLTWVMVCDELLRSGIVVVCLSCLSDVFMWCVVCGLLVLWCCVVCACVECLDCGACFLCCERLVWCFNVCGCVVCACCCVEYG